MATFLISNGTAAKKSGERIGSALLPFGLLSRVWVGSLFLLTLAGCSPKQTGPATVYQATGILQNYDRKTHLATIAHAPIPEYMPAMTMNFVVRDFEKLAALQPGDTLAFRLCVTKEESWVEELQKTGAGKVAAPDQFRRDPGLSVGDQLPDTELTDQSGRKLRLRDLQGQVVALTFIYTRCPLPDYCPLMSRNFQTTQLLLSRLGADRGAHFLSISMDPSNDSPGVLAEYAQNYQVDPKRWTFATGTSEAVQRLANAVGLQFQNVNGTINHNLRTVVVDAGGSIRHIFTGNSWTPQELAAEIRSAETAVSGSGTSPGQRASR